MKYINLIEKVLKKKAKKIFLKKQAGDMNKTFSNNTKAKKLINYRVSTKINAGIENFIDWYLKYYNKKI